jgi:hypothetical protein
MKANRETLEDQLEAYEQKLAGFKTFIRELNDRAAELGTDRKLFEEDLFEAQHNAEHYEGEIARIRQELGKSSGGPPRARTGAGGVLPQTAKQGLGSLVISAVSFLAGAFLGSKVKSRKRGAGDDK